MIENNWITKEGTNFIISFEDILEKEYYGFVYLIEEKDTGRFYIGEKSFISFFTPKGMTNKKKKESDWKTYTSSNKELTARIKKCGELKNEKYSFTILSICKDKSIMKYEECRQMMKFECLTSDKSYNENMKINILCSYKDYSKRVI